jgi:hypothetical protein
VEAAATAAVQQRWLHPTVPGSCGRRSEREALRNARIQSHGPINVTAGRIEIVVDVQVDLAERRVRRRRLIICGESGHDELAALGLSLLG